MLYAGKRPNEMSDEELEAAAVYCTRKVVEFTEMAELNKQALIELGLEYESRLPGHTVN